MNEQSRDSSPLSIRNANKAFRQGRLLEAQAIYEALLGKGGVYASIAAANLKLMAERSSLPGRKGANSSDSDSELLWQQLMELLESGLWDRDWYLKVYEKEISKFKIASKKDVTPEIFYLTEGWLKGHKPSEYFEFSNQAFPKELKINHLSYFLRNSIFRGYHFRRALPGVDDATVSKYWLYKSERGISSGVIYKCITGGYNKITNPPFVNFEWDYVIFSDCTNVPSRIGIWEVRPLAYRLGDGQSQNRWHKFFPHLALSEYEKSIYLDGNLDLRDNYVIETIENRRQQIVLPRHFARDCIYKEVEALLGSGRFNDIEKSKFRKQNEFLESEGFPSNIGLAENNLIYRVHDSRAVGAVMELWWWVYKNFSARDQLGLIYSMWRYGFDVQSHLIENTRINYRHCWISSHAAPATIKDKIKKKIRPVAKSKELILFSTNNSFCVYLAVAIESLIKRSNPSRFYDVVVLCTDLSAENQRKLLKLSEISTNVSVRLFDMSETLGFIDKADFHLEGYVPLETYYKFFVADITEEYEKCLYLDSDILINDDVGKLLDVELGGNSVGAALNVANIHAAKTNQEVKGVKFAEYLRCSLGIEDASRYFQAGVLSLDLNRLRSLDLSTLAIDTLKKIGKPLFFDQCVFNKIFHNDFKRLDVSWNHVWYLQDYSYLKSTVPSDLFYEYAKSRVAPSIIHYASKDKYYSKPEWILGSLFWKFVEKSMFFNDVIEDCRLRLSSDEFAHLKSYLSLGGATRRSPKLLVHLHLFYPDQIDFFLSRISNIGGVDFDLYVTQNERNRDCEKKLKALFPSVKIYTIANAGYDIYPFLLVLRNIKIISYDYVLKIHTKNKRDPGKDVVYGIKVPGYSWRNDLVDALLGTPEIFRKNIALLEDQRDIGLLSSGSYIFNSADNNEEVNYNLPYWRARMGLKSGSNYVGGSMFLARAFPFEKLKSHNLNENDFIGSGNFQTKDWRNLAHVFERLLGFVVDDEKYKFHKL